MDIQRQTLEKLRSFQTPEEVFVFWKGLIRIYGQIHDPVIRDYVEGIYNAHGKGYLHDVMIIDKTVNTDENYSFGGHSQLRYGNKVRFFLKKEKDLRIMRIFLPIPLLSRIRNKKPTPSVDIHVKGGKKHSYTTFRGMSKAACVGIRKVFNEVRPEINSFLGEDFLTIIREWEEGPDNHGPHKRSGVLYYRHVFSYQPRKEWPFMKVMDEKEE